VCLLAVSAGAVACISDEPFVGWVNRSQFFEYHDEVEEPLCPTLLDMLDHHAQMIGGKVGLVLDANHPYRYYKFRDAASFGAQSSGCPSHNGACALGNAIYASTFFHAHEQAHDYVYRAWGGWSDGLLNEGEAVALSCMPFDAIQPGQKASDVIGHVDWRDFLNLHGDLDAGYAAAGFFVTHLAEHFGWDSVRALHRRISSGASAGDVERAFREVYSISIDQAWSDALDTAGAPPCQRDWRCLATSMAVGEVASPECDGEMHRSIEVGASGGVVLSVSGDDSRLLLQSCADPAPTTYAVEGGAMGRSTTHWASLPPGTYTLFPGPLPASVALQSRFEGPLVESTCSATTSLTLDPSARASIDLLPGAFNGWLRLAGGGHMYDVYPFNLAWNGMLTAGPVSICDDCSAASCVPLPYGQTTRVLVTDRSVVHFQGVFALPSSSSVWGQLIFEPVTSD
jgi:hypothetical protein